jgi:hypothetical protein
MDDGSQGRDPIRGRVGNHRSANPVGIARPYSAAHISYTYGGTGNIIRVDIGNRKSGERSRLPNWYHWTIVAIALAGLFIIALIGVVYGG